VGRLFLENFFFQFYRPYVLRARSVQVSGSGCEKSPDPRVYTVSWIVGAKVLNKI
jgi:hypothetical protein